MLLKGKKPTVFNMQCELMKNQDGYKPSWEEPQPYHEGTDSHECYANQSCNEY